MKKNPEKYFKASGEIIGSAIKSGNLDAVEYTEYLLDLISKQDSTIFKYGSNLSFFLFTN